MSRLNDFHTDLAFSTDERWIPWWHGVYMHAFKDFKDMEGITALKEQRLGIDRILILSTGKQISVDEKLRRQFYDDILIEVWSSKEHNRPGWIQKGLYCDYLAYGFPGCGKAYVFPFQQLQRCFFANQDRWISQYKEVKAKNFGYTTVSIAIPTSILQKAVIDSMFINVAPDQSRRYEYICRHCRNGVSIVNLFHICASCELLSNRGITYA